MKFTKYILLPVLCTLVLAGNLFGQQRILLDKPVRAGQLILFPVLGDESNYYYLPDKPTLAVHPDGNPQFSFLRYVKNEETAANANTGISESTTGGGILHCLVELKVSDDMLRDAERGLRRIDGDGKILGPVVFKSGTVSLISSVAKENGEMTEAIVGLGNAPVLENQKSAVSVQLNKMGSKILWETFNTPTPDFSFQFEMEVEGYQSPKHVNIKANWDRIYKHEAFEAAIASPVLSGEINAAFDELTDNGAIEVTQIGDDEDLDKLKEAAYNQLINLMFDKIGGTGVPQLQQFVPNSNKSMLDRATEQLNKARTEARQENARIDRLNAQQRQHETQVRTSARSRANEQRRAAGREEIQAPQGDQARDSTATNNTAANTNNNESENENASGNNQRENVSMPNIAIAVSYKLKQVKRSGTVNINLNKYTATTRSMPFAYNPGNVKDQCPDCFREVNLYDPLMMQREVNATLGGVNSADFDYINFVNVIMKKEHQNGVETVDEIKIDRTQFNSEGNFFKMLYGWQGDDDRDKWLGYDYRTMWSFAGGHQVESDWINTEFGSIALEPPVVQKKVYVEADEDFIFDENIRAVEVKLFTTLGTVEKTTSLNLKTMKEELSGTASILLPRDVEDYEYQVTWFIKGQEPKTSDRKSSNFGRIDIDRFF